MNAYVIGHVLNQIPESGPQLATTAEEARFDRGLELILNGVARTAGLTRTAAVPS
ncbi:hypothetical protein ACE2AJ_19985 [Aquihabitans daechungensis]|uniref:hypothetical protein n=1 Tax=Aquihabitans daechungensis TaxID=1052257 RepID=UPI003BA2813B